MTKTRIFQNGNSQAIRIPQEMRTEKKDIASTKSEISISHSRLMIHGLPSAR